MSGVSSLAYAEQQSVAPVWVAWPMPPVGEGFIRDFHFALVNFMEAGDGNMYERCTRECQN